MPTSFEYVRDIIIIVTGKTDKARDSNYGNTATTSTKASPNYNSQARDIYDENEVICHLYVILSFLIVFLYILSC